MKKAMPEVLKYLLAVAATCALAALISQTDAIAQTPAGQQDFSQRGPNEVRAAEADWQDSARMRGVPVRIYAPAMKSGGERLPVILFSHGLGGNRNAGRVWAEHWASHGYIV